MLKEKNYTYFKENPDKRILFFFDPENEHHEEVEELEKSGIEVVWAGSGFFKLKYRLEHELKDKKVFLYFKSPEPSGVDRHEYALLDLLVANKVLRLDLVSEFIEEFNLNAGHREIIKKYRDVLKTKAVKAFLSGILNSHDLTQNSIEPALISYILDLKKIGSPELILAGIMSRSLDEAKLSRSIDRIIKLGLDKRILHWISNFFDYTAENFNINTVREIINRFKYNLITGKLEADKGDPYTSLKIGNFLEFEKMKKVFWEWQKSSLLSEHLYEVLEKSGSEIKEEIIYERYGNDSDYGLLTEKLKLIFLEEIIEEIREFPEKADKKLTKLSEGDMRNIELNNTVSFLKISIMFIIRLNVIKTFRFNSLEDYVKKYSEDLYKIDMFFRRGQVAYGKVNAGTLDTRVDIDGFVKNTFYKMYTEFLIKLNNEWLDCAKREEYKFNSIDTDQQSGFYNKYLKNESVKVAVIISDALRYESGVELLHELHKDPKNEAQIGTMLSSVPTDTDIGMTNLLPHKSIEYDNGKYFIDEIETVSSKRGKILKKYKEDSETITYNGFKRLGLLTEARELFKKDLVYIYHDTIDSAGHGGTKVLKEVGTAVEELSTLIKKLHSSLNVTKVIITADHGFIYLPEKVEDPMKEDAPVNESIKLSKRYILTDKKIDRINNHFFPLKNASIIKNDLQVILPNGINRFRIKGGSSDRYMHGGASLQEMIIPVIESRRKKEDISVKVSIKMVSRELKILSGILKFILIQDKKVSMTHKPLKIKAGIYNGTEPVSDLVYYTFESTSDQASVRTASLSISLNSEASSLRVLKLRIFDIDDDLNPLIEEQVINKTLIEKDEF